MLQCSYCAKEFKYESEKKRHEQSHVPQFECKECSKKFSFLSALKRHQKQHQRTCSVVCSNCGRNFRDESLLKRHIKYAHTGVHICTKCDGKFNSEIALSVHMKTHKPTAERRYKCSFTGCNKSFNFKHHLKHHEPTHTNEKQHYCKICEKGFIQLHHLKTHLKSHESTNWFNCPNLDCNAKFSTGCSLKRHLVTHSTITCTTCAQLIKLSQYKKHMERCILKEEKTNDFLVKRVTTNEIKHNNAELEPEFSNCKTILGRCIVSEDSSDNNCICAQIKTYVDFHVEPFNTPNEPTKPTKSPDKVVLSNTCERCDCPSLGHCSAQIENIRQDLKDLPQLEYRNDGVIKIKDTFDIDISEVFSVRDKVKVDETKELIKFDNFVPYNSCKAVLGKCIVSGNGTISEECLCAKMAMEDQTIEQEIDEITPQPVKSTG